MTIKKPYGSFVVYALLDPDTNSVFYVGRSKNAKTRIGQHMNEAKDNSYENWFDHLWRDGGSEKSIKPTSNVNKVMYINDIQRRGKLPIVKIVDQWYCESLADANRLEEAWIAEMRRQGHPLTNVILSHRMRPEWYSGRRVGWAASPMEYIKMLKEKNIEFGQKNAIEQSLKKKPVRRKSSKWDSRKLGR